MTTLHEHYDDEPQDIFLPLPPDIYCELYNLEMKTFAKDIPFYLTALPAASNILELGCGSGRVSRHLAGAGHVVTGVDLSEPMLHHARSHQTKGVRYVCMDMQQLAFRHRFDAIVIPYNTINLLSLPGAIAKLFATCKALLVPQGRLLFQVQLPTNAIRTLADHGTAFVFDIFDRPAGGKVVKEVLRSLDAHGQILQMTERYRIRPMNGIQLNANYSHTFRLLMREQGFWLAQLHAAGFTNLIPASTYPGSECSPEGLLLLNASA